MDETMVIRRMKHYLQVLQHKARVFARCAEFAGRLMARAVVHDASKFSEAETDGFTKAAALGELPYMSDEYKSMLQGVLKPAIAHHYAKNSHHPEHFENGVDGMNLLDLVEMKCDWEAACKQTKNGDIVTSLDFNEGRFGLSEQLYRILFNEVTRDV